MTAADYLQQLARLSSEGRLAEAADLSADAVEDHPRDERLQRARAIVLRQANQPQEAEEHLLAVLAENSSAAWAHAQLGVLYQHRQHDRAIDHYRRAHHLEPAKHDYRLALIHALTRTGEGIALDEAYALLRPVLNTAGTWAQNDLHIAYDLLARVCAYDDLDALGDPLDLGLKWAEAGNHSALYLLLNQATDPERRSLLVALHQLAAMKLEPQGPSA